MKNYEYLIQTVSPPTIAQSNEKPPGSGLMALFVLFFIFYLTLIMPMKTAWKKLPTLRQYLANHPECDTNAGVKCCHCGSRSLRNWGQRAANDSRRIHICNSCGRKLYRSELSKYTTY